MSKLVTIIIPCHISHKLLEKCIHSAQKQKCAEILVVVDSDSVELIDKVNSLKPDGVILSSMRSASKARQIGIENTYTEYIAFLDSDDEIIDNELDNQLDWMISNEILWSCSHYVARNNKSKSYKVRSPAKIDRNLLLKRNFIGNSTVIIHRKLLPKILPSGPIEDFKLWLEISKEYDCFAYQQVGRIYNLHEKQISNNKIKQLVYRYSVLRKEFGILKSIHLLTYHVFGNLNKIIFSKYD